MGYWSRRKPKERVRCLGRWGKCKGYFMSTDRTKDRYCEPCRRIKDARQIAMGVAEINMVRGSASLFDGRSS